MTMLDRMRRLTGWACWVSFGIGWHCRGDNLVTVPCHPRNGRRHGADARRGHVPRLLGEARHRHGAGHDPRPRGEGTGPLALPASGRDTTCCAGNVVSRLALAAASTRWWLLSDQVVVLLACGTCSLVQLWRSWSRMDALLLMAWEAQHSLSNTTILLTTLMRVAQPRVCLARQTVRSSARPNRWPLRLQRKP